MSFIGRVSFTLFQTSTKAKMIYLCLDVYNSKLITTSSFRENKIIINLYKWSVVDVAIFRYDIRYQETILFSFNDYELIKFVCKFMEINSFWIIWASKTKIQLNNRIVLLLLIFLFKSAFVCLFANSPWKAKTKDLKWKQKQGRSHLDW